MENEKCTLERNSNQLKKNILDLNEKIKNLEFQLEERKRENDENIKKSTKNE